MSRLRRKLSIMVLVGLVVGIVVFGGTLTGLWGLRVATWDEEAYVGRPLDDLRAFLSSRNVELQPYDRFSLFTHTKRQLRPNERAFIFQHGAPYSWFLVGEAVNVGYVVARQEGIDPSSVVVAKIDRGQQVDTL